jgi:AcrR family transcriptional regulator
MVTGKAPRADAVRNRRKIMAAARDAITALGPEAGMDQIAAAAGVAVGTLYRHFPTKTDLVAAVISEHLEQMADAAEASYARTLAGARPVDELTAFLAHVIEAAATNRAVKAAAQTLGASHDQAPAHRARRALGQLIAAAQADGAVTTDLTVDDIYLLVMTAPVEQPAPARRRWLSLLLTGITTPSPD